MIFRRISVLATIAVLFSACSRPSQIATKSASETSSEVRIQEIPPADPEKFSGSRDTKAWRNPYLMLKKDGIWLVDLANNEEHLVKSDQVLDALADLPATAWPYGRVVAVQEIGSAGSEEDKVALRRNRAILAGTLENAKVLINWLPPA